MKHLPKLAIAVVLALSVWAGIGAVSAQALDRAGAEYYFNQISNSSCGNGSTWVCYQRYDSNCTWISHNYFWCDRYWVEISIFGYSQEQEGYGHLSYQAPGVWVSWDYTVRTL